MKKILSALMHVLLLATFTVPATLVAQNWNGYSSVNQRQMENLDRGLVAVKSNAEVFVSWRLLGTDDKNISFNIYRGDVKLNSTPVTGATNYTDKATDLTVATPYKIGIIDPNTQIESFSKTVYPWDGNSKILRLARPGDTSTASYSPNDCSVGDLDGDGEYEIIVKWDPNNSKDNSQSGDTDKVYLDAYKLDGTFMWRIDLGLNIRAGAHYTQFMVYDLDGDGIAEIACKTAPGTKDGTGKFISDGPAEGANHNTLYRNSSGYVLSGPEYLTVFEGRTGKELSTIDYTPQRGTVSSWGDSYGNRIDRFLACVAYLDGVTPSLVMCRGYYTRSALAAYDFKNGKLTQHWYHNSSTSGQGAYGQGNHNLSVADVDGDGCDEIIYGSAVIDHDGKLKCRTGLGHGDALHVSDLDPDRPGYEVWHVAEEKSIYNHSMYDPNTGAIIWHSTAYNSDNGRGLAADIDPNHRGFEMWSSAESGFYNCKGTKVADKKPSINHRIYWDGDLQDEILDGVKLDKWDPTSKSLNRLVTFEGSSINTTKANPCLTADLFGDWREEAIFAYDNDRLIIYTTNIATTHRLYTLMHDPVYRLSIAWQNVAYNQPPHLGFYMGDGLDDIPYPNMYAPKAADVPSNTVNLLMLKTLIAEASTLLQDSEEGSGLFQYPHDAFADLQAAIKNAEELIAEVDAHPEAQEWQAAVNAEVVALYAAIDAFKIRQNLTYIAADPDKYYNIYSYGTGNAGATAANTGMTKKFMSASGTALVLQAGTSDANESGKSDPIRKDEAAQWRILPSEVNPGMITVQNRATGRYLQISKTLAANAVDVCFFYRKTDNGNPGFSVQAEVSGGKCFQVADDASVNTTNYADRVRMRWIVEEVQGTSVGIEPTEEGAKSIRHKEYVDLLGRKVNKETLGVLIEVITYEDGSVASRKILNVE